MTRLSPPTRGFTPLVSCSRLAFRARRPPQPPFLRVGCPTRWDYLANTTDWGDDASSFYERSLGGITNGDDESGTLRPSALYLASNIGSGGLSLVDGGAGWVEVDYGAGGNVTTMTVHSQCDDAPSETCADPGGSLDARRDALREGCACVVEQHYVYRWDELNRLSEARRYDRESGTWVSKVRQRYRYDASNVRTVKQTLHDDSATCSPASAPCERIALYAYPGDFERRGLIRGTFGYEADVGLGTETQYMIAGARTVWKHSVVESGGYDREHRFTVGLTDLIQTTAAVIDVRTGELLETSTYYPNGARETYLVDSATVTAPEVAGFTGKEADEEIGVVYFGERYLIPRLGRWASPDPLHVHAVGGGEALNSFHYISGNLLLGRDPVGLDDAPAFTSYSTQSVAPRAGNDHRSIVLASGRVLTVDSSVNIRFETTANSELGRSGQFSVENPGENGLQPRPLVRIAVSGESTANVTFRQWASSSGTYTASAAGRQLAGLRFAGSYTTRSGQLVSWGPQNGYKSIRAADSNPSAPGYPNYNGLYTRTRAEDDRPSEYAMYDAPIANEALTNFMLSVVGRAAIQAAVVQEFQTEVVEDGMVTAEVRWQTTTTVVRGRVAAPEGAAFLFYSAEHDLTYFQQHTIDSLESVSPRPVDPSASGADEK